LEQYLKATTTKGEKLMAEEKYVAASYTLPNKKFINHYINLMKEHGSHLYIHAHNVAAYSEMIASEMGINEDVKTQIVRGAFLHDIGKLSVPLEILEKKEKLTEADWKIIRRHPISCLDLLPADITKLELQIITMHHEKMDGEGYPFGINNISQEVFIVQTADIFDALVSERAYKSVYSTEAAFDNLYDRVILAQMPEEPMAALERVIAKRYKGEAI